MSGHPNFNSFGCLCSNPECQAFGCKLHRGAGDFITNPPGWQPSILPLTPSITPNAPPVSKPNHRTVTVEIVTEDRIREIVREELRKLFTGA